MSPQVEIKVRENGPYKVTGPIRLIDADGNEYDVGEPGESIVLCRCGGSTTKPFCDGTHRRAGFRAPEKAVLTARAHAREPAGEEPDADEDPEAGEREVGE